MRQIWRVEEGSRADFAFDPAQDRFTCPDNKLLKQYCRNFSTPRSGSTKDGLHLYRASKSDCQLCELKARCCPNTPAQSFPEYL